MNELKNWSEVTKGLYRYIVGANVCYEIHILYDSYRGDILDAKASLFLVGIWREDGREQKNYFERACLLAGQSVFQCLHEAEKDYKENMR